MPSSVVHFINGMLSKEIKEYARALSIKRHREKTAGDDMELRKLVEFSPRGGVRNKQIAILHFNRTRKQVEAITESYIDAFRKFGQVPEVSDREEIMRELASLVSALRENQLSMTAELMPRGVSGILANMNYQGLVSVAKQELSLASQEMIAEASQRSRQKEERPNVHVEVMKVGDEYKVGQGVAGRNVHAHEIDFNQQWNEIDNRIDLSHLAKELKLLRTELRKEGTEPEHDVAIGAIGSAEMAAKEGNGPKTLESLKTAGKWALDVATKIGVNVAAEAIKKASGM